MLKNKFITIIFSMVLGGPGLLTAQDTLTLKEAIENGLENNHDIRIERKNKAIDDNNLTRGNAGFLPTLNLNADQSTRRANTNQQFISGESINRKNARSTNLNTRAELQWTLFDGFNMFTTYNRLEEIRELGQQEFRKTVITNVESIIDQYYDIVQQRQKLSTLKETLQLSRERRSLAQNQYEVGSGSKMNYLQAKVDYNSDTSAYLNQQETLRSAKIRLNQLLGVNNVNQEFSVTQAIPLRNELAYNDLEEFAMENNPDLEIARQNQKVANLSLKQVEAEQYPEIGVNVGYDFTRSTSEAGFVSESQQNGLDYGLFLSYNLFNGFNVNRRKQNARLEIDKSQIRQEQTLQTVKSDLRVAYNNYQNNLSLVQLEEENVEVAKESHEVAKANYESGRTSYLELKEAQNNYLDAQNRLTEARYQAKQSEAELLRISGLLLEMEMVDGIE